MRRLKSCSSVSWLFFLCVGISYAADSLRAGKFMRDYEFLESSNKRFQLLFFTHDPYINRYVTIQRYLGIQDMNFRDIDNAVKTMMVWVANPKNPLNDSSGVLNITQDGNLVITDHNGLSIALYSGHPPAMSSAINTSTLTLLDSGNLVLRAGDERIVWQSFDYPTDTWLPGMKLGLFDLNTVKPRQQFLTSWVSPEVRAPGAFTLGIDPNNTKQLVVRRRGVLYWSSGMWNGHNFTYFPNDELIGLSYFSNERESYFTYSMTNSSNYLSSLIVMHSSGTLYSLKSNSNVRIMDSILQCDADGVEETSKGCTKPEPSKCRGGDAFNRTSGQMSGFWGYWNIGFNYSLALSDCKEICRRNCSCNAYEYDGYTCLLYGGQVESLGGQQYFFLRNGTAHAVKGIPTPPGHPNTSTAPSDSPNTAPPDLPRRRKLWVTIGGSFASLVVLAALSLFCYLRYGNWLFGGMKKDGSCKDGMKKRTKQLMNGLSFNITGAINDLSAQKQGLIGKDHELPLFSFHSIQFATDHFSEAKKIGQGGFGPVY